jgi:hypothetical protein
VLVATADTTQAIAVGVLVGIAGALNLAAARLSRK